MWSSLPKEENTYAWLIYALDMIDHTNTSQYCDMYDFIHMDVKWFHLTHDQQCFIL